VAFVLHLHPFGRGARGAMLLSLACFGLVPGIARLVSDSHLAAFAGIGIGLILYAAGLWRLRRVLLLAELFGLRRGARASAASSPQTSA
jgi:hypothetical protein